MLLSMRSGPQRSMFHVRHSIYQAGNVDTNTIFTEISNQFDHENCMKMVHYNYHIKYINTFRHLDITECKLFNLTTNSSHESATPSFQKQLYPKTEYKWSTGIAWFPTIFHSIFNRYINDIANSLKNCEKLHSVSQMLDHLICTKFKSRCPSINTVNKLYYYTC